MKKLISLTLALIMCLSVFSVAAFATEENTRNIASIELHKVKYYEAVYNEAEIASAALYVNFLVYYTDGTTAVHDSAFGWEDPTVTSEVTWYLKPENDENYGSQQSLYVTIDGVDYWAGYVNVQIDPVKAALRNIITWDWMTCDEKIQGLNLIAKLLKLVFRFLIEFVEDNDLYNAMFDIADALEDFSGEVYENSTGEDLNERYPVIEDADEESDENASEKTNEATQEDVDEETTEEVAEEVTAAA